ncbi:MULTISPECIES: hypothetical protein [Escherichia]|uniref:hypothetical protein n=1 Tax=Escherichia TaxID=561 RepID=UPI000FDBFF00|nr:hypothetical protein [Escherichia coli]AZW03541.1 hypothetical protein CRG85_05640 [Escherichia coli]EKY0831816.1 hypothetical protein [Escherichia coli]MCA7492974.1 hypothetical protein [Escherichia coli]HDC9027212.1 hypothetical protein [Escherichia coli]HDP6901489.1 hypothetical protein [Escherichia coli]
MDSYIFLTDDKRIGFAQIDETQQNFHMMIPESHQLYRYKSFPWQENKERIERQGVLLEWVTGEDILTKILSTACWFYDHTKINITHIQKSDKNGVYTPRCCRRNYMNSMNSTFNHIELLDELRSFKSICDNIVYLFNFIEPEENNLFTYGNKIRENLILACNEVEYLLVQFLNINNYTKDRLNTTDFVKSQPHLKLNEYTVKFKNYPLLGEFSPFKDWNSASPTKSIPWYDAYNKVKHNRGTNRETASLKALISSAAAIHILISAQYGLTIFSHYDSDYQSIFQTIKAPSWILEDFDVPDIKTGSMMWTTPTTLTI